MQVVVLRYEAFLARGWEGSATETSGSRALLNRRQMARGVLGRKSCFVSINLMGFDLFDQEMVLGRLSRTAAERALRHCTWRLKLADAS